MEQPEIETWGDFSSPFFLTRHPRPEVLNPVLSSLFLGLEAEGETHRNPYKTPSNQEEIFESSFELFKRPEPCIQQLKEFCMYGIWQAVARTNGYSEEECRKMHVFTDAWFHITLFGGYISNHTHPMAAWSAVYMVDPGEQPEDHPQGGVLSFKDPRPHANMYLDRGNNSWQRPYHVGSVNYAMKPGELMIFPSFLQHEVTPYFGRKPRITVAMNCSFRESGVLKAG
jgi:Putative 2OG-Fe(II) oxygenase